MLRDVYTMVYEDGTVKKVTTKDLQVEVGKYKGRDLAEVDDVSYLTWMKKACEEKKEDWSALMISMRLKELS